MGRKTFCITTMLMVLAIGADNQAFSQAYPNKSIRLIVPWPAGGPVDITARIIGQKLTEPLGQQVIIDNRSGADGSIGSGVAAKAVADGYTLLIASTSTHSIDPVTYPQLTYDPVKDFAPVSLLDTRPYLLIAHLSVPVKSMKALIALAKSKPGQLAYASAGETNHTAAELFKTSAGIDLLHVPYQGGAPALNALLSGEVAIFFAPIPIALAQFKAGKVTALAVTGAKRVAMLPDIPTMSEAGLRGFEFSTWDAILAPAKTPDAIVTRLSMEIAKILQMPDVQEKFSALGASAGGSTPEELASYMKVDAEKWRKILKAAGTAKQ